MFVLVVLSLNSAISTFKPDVQEMMKNFTGFAELWEKVKFEFSIVFFRLISLGKLGTGSNCESIYGIKTING